MNRETENRAHQTDNVATNIVLVSFIGDALVLGPHWIYNQDAIRAKFGFVTAYRAPVTTYPDATLPEKWLSGLDAHDEIVDLIRSEDFDGC